MLCISVYYHHVLQWLHFLYCNEKDAKTKQQFMI